MRRNNEEKWRDYCQILGDMITFYLKSGEEMKHFGFHYDVSQEMIYKGFKKNRTLKKLKKRSIENDFYLIGEGCSLVEILPALLADISHYNFVMQENIKKGKITIVFDLMRKVVLEHMFLLEMMIGDTKYFFDSYGGGKNRSYSPTSGKNNKYNGSNSFALHKNLTKRCFQLTNSFCVLGYQKFINLRYKGLLYKLGNQANHLVTNAEVIETQPGSLNMIFDAAKNMKKYQESYYKLMPHILNYLIDLIEYLLNHLTDIEESSRVDGRDYNRKGMYAHFLYEYDPKLISHLKNTYCWDCGITIELNKEIAKQIFYTTKLQCPGCGVHLIKLN